MKKRKEKKDFFLPDIFKISNILVPFFVCVKMVVVVVAVGVTIKSDQKKDLKEKQKKKASFFC